VATIQLGDLFEEMVKAIYLNTAFSGYFRAIAARSAAKNSELAFQIWAKVIKVVLELDAYGDSAPMNALLMHYFVPSWHRQVISAINISLGHCGCTQIFGKPKSRFSESRPKSSPDTICSEKV
jgi:hypothetical protein